MDSKTLEKISEWTLFSFSDNIISLFSEEYCWLLAKALHQILGGEIYGITEFHISTIKKPPCSCEPLHYVLLYKEKFIDIRGMWSEKDLLDDWRNMMIEISSRNKIFDYKLTLSDSSSLPNYQVEDEIIKIANECAREIVRQLQ